MSSFKCLIAADSECISNELQTLTNKLKQANKIYSSSSQFPKSKFRIHILTLINKNYRSFYNKIL